MIEKMENLFIFFFALDSTIVPKTILYINEWTLHATKTAIELIKSFISSLLSKNAL